MEPSALFYAARIVVGQGAGVSTITAPSDTWPGAPTAGQILVRIRRENRSESEKGRWFENLFLQMIRDMPEFAISKAYRWADWPDRERLTRLPAVDSGIDLVAVTNDGRIVAIQCKCYREEHTIQRAEIDSFLAVSGPPFDMRWVVATCRWGRNAEEVIDSLEPPVRRIDFHEYGKAPVSEWRFKREKREPLELQKKAIEHVVTGLRHNDRGQLIMACGTGKTYTTLRIAERIVSDGDGTGGRRILFLAPSIALVSQARREWLRHTTRPLSGIVVCSDRTSGGRNENEEDMRVSELECDVTTNPEAIAEKLLKQDKTTCVVFCTYQSLDKVSKAQTEHGAPDFDLTIADEAHRTTGIEKNTGFGMVHDNELLRSRKRLYMTATQRIYTAKSKTALARKGHEVRDMEDYGTYGHVMHSLSFKEAVKAGILSDYRVIILTIPEGGDAWALYEKFVTLRTGDDRERALTYQDVIRLLGTVLAVNGITRSKYEYTPKQLSKVIGFANSRVRSKAFTQLLGLPELHDVAARRAGVDSINGHEVEHLDGTSSALQRNRALRELEEAGTDSPRMICNVKLFTEGVDVPSLDAVAFLDPRDSAVDVVQAVGRVMRSAKGKQFGYIIVPVPVRPGEDVIESLEGNPEGWKTTGLVLRALQSHDGRLPENPLRFIQLGGAGMIGGGDDGDSVTIEGIQSTLKFQEVSEKLYTRVVSTSGLVKPGQAVSDEIKWAVETAAGIFMKARIAEDLAGVLNLSIGRDEFTGMDACKIAALLVTNACLLHRRLLDVMGDGLVDLNDVCGSDDPCGMLHNAWTSILQRDYAPVFEPALGVIGALPRDGSAVDMAVYRMADCANRMADSLSELGYDHAGPLYHDILGTAKSDSAFYTHNVSAVLLARLALTDGFTDWNDADRVRHLRIMDPACGTGTLLMAALKTIKDRMGYANLPEESRGSIHRRLVEDVIYGLDINRHAVQLAACNLTLGAPTIDYKKMNLYTMRHGPQPGGGGVKAGSVEILRTASDRDIMQTLVQPMRSIADL